MELQKKIKKTYFFIPIYCQLHICIRTSPLHIGINNPKFSLSQHQLHHPRDVDEMMQNKKAKTQKNVHKKV